MQALSNLKILDFSTLVPGPFATMMLADLGANVLRVESPTRPDMIRAMGPFSDGTSTAHAVLNRSKRSIGLDLKNPAAVDMVKKLVANYDIIVEQFRPGVMDRLGVGFETLREINPKLIYCSITGYGQTGPNRDRAGHDNNYLSLSGLNGYSGRDGNRTPIMGMPLADLAGGSLHSIVGILAAVNQRTQTGLGQHVDISMTDAIFGMSSMFGSHFLAGNQEPKPGTTTLNGGIFYDYYLTADGRNLSIGSLEPQFFNQLCVTLGLESFVDLGSKPDAESQQKFKQLLEATIVTKSLAEWVDIFKDKDACVEPVLTLAEACESEQIKQRDLIVTVDTYDGAVQNQIGTAIKLSDSPSKYGLCGAPLGHHNQSVMEELGMSEHEMDAATKSGMFG
ncbi:MAG: Acetyl-CoA:oxalate CoA-transferase [Porticoccaceae bacterium UBA1117]|nr:CaiB/BaiF CoA-transferase family protein [Porticoccaceae bacterium]CAI8324264.1 MAG: Acetyl-CoA:oxalate CoA-transferase [Porticoccaceae bacterium UBA1117]|tara:strand:+ start:95 stop:1273 length:1179 start_codon:yes stop_codon:yes gene_type:complete